MHQSRLLIGFLTQFLAPLIGGTLLAQPADADGWPVFHANPASSGWVDVETSAAQNPAVVRGGMGSFADGYAPVVAPDGAVVLVTEQGRVMALDAGGNPRWERQLNGGFGAQSTPAISSNGNIYLLSTRTVNDHTVTPSVKRIEVELNGFSPGGAWLFHSTVPGLPGAVPTAPLNIMRAPDGAELIVFPILYHPPNSTAMITHLFAYSLTGSKQAEATVTSLVTPIEGGWNTFWASDFSLGFEADEDAIQPFRVPLPGVAVMPNDASTVVINDGINSVAQYRFDGTAFQEVWRNKHVQALTPPAISKNGVPFAAEYSHYFAFNEIGGLKETGDIGGAAATPTLLPNGAIVFVTPVKRIAIAKIPGVGEFSIELGSGSAVAAAASRNLIYVAAKNALLSYRSDNFQLVGTYGWQNGGRAAPVIGPGGHVYAIADNKLHIFPPNTGPASRDIVSGGGVVGDVGGGATGGNESGKPTRKALDPAVLTSPNADMNDSGAPSAADSKAPAANAPQQAALPNRQRFDPPLTPSGKPLSACVDGKFRDCGRSAARAFCQSMGFAKASDIDIDSKRVQAETLGGAVCTSSKCKVVDKVTCSR
jgi:hypothetical protein